MNESFITEDMLVQAGVPLEDKDVPALLETLNSQLSDRVGGAIIAMLDDEQVEDLVELQESEPTDEALATWLQDTIPNFQEVVDTEINTLLSESL